MIVVPPVHFQHVRDLPGQFDSIDPRRNTLQEDQVDIDLRDCEFVRAAAVLWCLIYPLLWKHRGSNCRLLVPSNLGVCIYLKSMGLFHILNENGIDADDRGVYDRPDPQLILPLTRFETESQVEALINVAYDALQKSGLGAANLYPIVSEVFAELAMNAVQHAESPIGAYGFLQFYRFEAGQRFVFGVADDGIGIKRSLEKNPEHRDRVPYDWDAIELAAQERISGTGDKARGIGLFGVAEDMRRAGRQLIIHSGIELLQISEDMKSEALKTRLFPGTLAYASIPT